MKKSLSENLLSAMKNLSRIFILLLLPACAHSPAKKQDLLTGLAIDYKSEFKQIANLPYEPSVTRSFSTSNNEILKIVELYPLTKKSAFEQMNRKKALIQRLFETEKEPYFGNTIDKEHCIADSNASEIKQINANTAEMTFLLYATKEYVYGACAKQNFSYESILTLLYCEQSQRYFEIKTFKPLAQKNAEYPKFTCL